MAGWLSASTAAILFPIATLILGLIIGFLAQRSGFCSIGGFRDLLLFKHTRLFLGFLALIGSAIISYIIFRFILPAAFPGFPWFITHDPLSPIPGAPAGLTSVPYIILGIVGGMGMGILGVFLGGCPLRQTVMVGEGQIKSLFFVIGMAVGALIFHLWISPLIIQLFS